MAKNLHNSAVLGFIFWCLLNTAPCFLQAQTIENPDSLSYELQRKRVNDMLEERKIRFSEYDLSLDQKSGLFGLFKSKNDWQKSLEILKQVILADNNIFVETQKLLKIKDFEKERFQQLAEQYDQQATAYIGTIEKLRQENEKLKAKIDSAQNVDHHSNMIVFILILAVLLLGYFLFKTRRDFNNKKSKTSGNLNQES